MVPLDLAALESRLAMDRTDPGIGSVDDYGAIAQACVSAGRAAAEMYWVAYRLRAIAVLNDRVLVQFNEPLEDDALELLKRGGSPDADQIQAMLDDYEARMGVEVLDLRDALMPTQLECLGRLIAWNDRAHSGLMIAHKESGICGSQWVNNVKVASFSGRAEAVFEWVWGQLRPEAKQPCSIPHSHIGGAR